MYLSSPQGASSRERTLPNKELVSLISECQRVGVRLPSTGEVPIQAACQNKLRPLRDTLPHELLSGGRQEVVLLSSWWRRLGELTEESPGLLPLGLSQLSSVHKA